MDAASSTLYAFPRDEFLERARGKAYPAFQRDGALTPEALSFLNQIYDDATADDLPGVNLEDVLAIAYDFWAWGDVKKPDARIVRARPATGVGNRLLERDLLEAIGPDMPFLVRSVMAEIAEQGRPVLAMFHPIVKVSRDAKGKRGAGTSPESMIQVHLEQMSTAQSKALIAGVEETLGDVRAVVEDFQPMRARMRDIADELEKAKTNAPAEEVEECVAFLRWLEQDNFTFLGARDYQFPRAGDGGFVPDEPIVLDDTGLGVLRNPDVYVLRRGSEPSLLTPEIEGFLMEPTPLLVSKSNLKSRVHRRATADYIGVKRYDANGEAVGETRFVGLFTADAYNRMTSDIPLLRRKVRRVLEASGAAKGTHNYSVLTNILETYPRDELFQIGELELLQTSLGILHLMDRPRPRIFVRRDRFNRFVSVLAYLPKDRFNSTLREAVGERLVAAYGGRLEAFYTLLGEGPLARINYVIQDIDKQRAEPDIASLEADVARLTRTWEDRFEALAHETSEEAEGAALVQRFRTAFTAAYRERFDAAEALIDIEQITHAQANETVRVRAYRLDGDGDNRLRCKIYAKGEPLSLSATMPVLENMGLYIDFETAFPIRPADGTGPFFVHDLSMRSADGAAIDYGAVESSFEEAFAAAWNGLAENDGFNRLILKLGVSWRDAALIRALARYRGQTGLDPSQAVQETALANNPEIVRQILALFRVRFDPSLPEPAKDREAWAKQIVSAIDALLDKVTSLDEDRVLRRIAKLVSAILRTNFYQRSADGALKSYMSFKIASPEVEDLPDPKPYREIWVWSPQVEGVHLRFGPVARGGLRWSDRRDDFRSEVLDLVKAQQVKNAIIVPVGAKGGFFPKKLPRDGKPADVRAAAVEAYKTFLRGLLDITDNIDGDKVVKPKNVVAWDGDDPYLVVAADKGTATFSDIANGISAEYGHWLGDAFASGGSAGYDHKAMGITARGAWEAVKRHFREMGRDIQTTPFDVIGVGDMSGDVFGNGMLLSKKTRLIAAFDHRDIFLDPNPSDLDAAWTERKRLYDLPGSRWKDYDAKLISKGGGVYARQDKAIPLSAEIKALTGLSKDSVPPSELLNALLKVQADLIWFGGIGTFIKAALESHADASDKTNDGVRVNAEEVRAAVVGEGANLGVTQRGRIAFARKGGRINTDAVDNSAGVDTSDHEVNIKILLSDALRVKALKAEEREPLLVTMTDDVAAHVLQHNYDQTLALTLAESTAAADLDAHERFVQRMEAKGKLSRKVETLPNSEGFADLRAKHLGLTRPELSKLIAYSKIDLFDALVASTAPDDPHFEGTLRDYFPPQLGKFEASMKRHRLRREIIATVLADDIVNASGPTFVDRVHEAAQAEAPAIALAFEAARHIFDLDTLATAIDALDNKVPAAAQTALYQERASVIRRLTIALLSRGAVGDVVGKYRAPIAEQRAALAQTLTAEEQAQALARREALMQTGTPEKLAGDVASLGALVAALDIADLAEAREWPVLAAASLYRAVGAALGVERIRAGAASLSLAQHWDRLALRRLLVEIGVDQRVLADAAMRKTTAPKTANAEWGVKAASEWLSGLGAQAAPTMIAMGELGAAGPWSFAKTVLAAAELRRLAGAVSA